MLPPALAGELQGLLGAPIRHVHPIGGGCIANATKVVTSEGPFFLKWGSVPVGETFPAEAEGLRILRAAASPLAVPDVLAARLPTADVPGFLLLEWIEPGKKGPGFWEAFGRGMAALHRHEGPGYGGEADNFIGSLPQRNGWMEGWPDFFRERRIAPQVAMARARNAWRQEWDAPLDRLLSRLADLLPESPERSTLHGDLWNGNYMVAESGTPVLIDPAAYFGHRETDLAMTELFGGFDSRFHAAYREAWRLDSGYEERREVYNLYHLLNHLNLFGGGYAGSVAAVFRRFA